jgi:hypothetical protein
MPRLRGLDGPEQADQRSQQRHSQAHPHDLASSSAPSHSRPLSGGRLPPEQEAQPVVKIVRLGSVFVRDPLTKPIASKH